MSAPALKVEDLTVRYGHVTAVDGLSLQVGEGEVVAILGANGAGKTSAMRALAGALRATVTGSMELFGERVTRRQADRLVPRGLVLVPEGRQVVAPLTVEDNLLLGAYHQRSRRRVAELLAQTYELFPILGERRNGVAGLLSGGEQQMLAFGRAMMADPKVILADEPSMGLAPIMVDKVIEMIGQLNARGAAVLLVEQNAPAALRVASRGYVLDQGRVVHAGTPAELLADDLVAETFLGLHRGAPTGA